MFGLELGFVMDLFAYLGIGAKKRILAGTHWPTQMVITDV